MSTLPLLSGRVVARRFGWAWVGLALLLGVHVADEALTDFLSVYNPAVEAIRQRLPWIPLPTFTFEIWLAGLILLVSFLLPPFSFSFRGARWMGWRGGPFGAV